PCDNTTKVAQEIFWKSNTFIVIFPTYMTLLYKLKVKFIRQVNTICPYHLQIVVYF
uniref:Uncharacterized protein n=1 Tax=Oryza brachyantha TaxID=4533 RepID=J3LB59_ORYBR